MDKRVLVRLFWDVLIVMFLLGFILALLWYTTGSLETMPAEEQQEKARIGAVLSMLATGVPGVICAAVRRRVK